MLRTIEFKSESAYNSWLRRMSGKIRIVSVSTTKRWSLWTGFIGDTKTYTITYDLFDTTTGINGIDSRTDAISPGAVKLMAVVVAAVILAMLFRGVAGFVAFVACFFIAYLVPILRVSPGKKLITIGTVIAIVVGIEIHETVNTRREERLKATAAHEIGREAAENQAALQQAFNSMTPAEHLAEVKRLLHPGASGLAFIEANKHIEAIPAGTPEWRSASALRFRFIRDAQKRAADLAERAAREKR